MLQGKNYVKTLTKQLIRVVSPIMIKVFKVFAVSIFVLTVFVGPHVTFAADKISDRDALLSRIEELRAALAQRTEFAVKGPVAKSADDPEYFKFEITNEDLAVYGRKTTVLTLQTDGSVAQILVSIDCSDVDGTLFVRERECSDEYWLSEYDEKDGIRTFKLPLRLSTPLDNTKFRVSFHACRYNGCQFEDKITVSYKDKITFADQVKIFDRYEWQYEWNDNTYHVQEVLLNFPFKDIRKVKLRVTCDVSGLYIRTDEELRATCNSKRDYSPVEFGAVETDEMGNVYNLRIESVTDNITKDQVGSVKMLFTFINWQNRVVHELTHIPIQLEEPIE